MTISVWEELSTRSNISEKQARQVCRDFYQVTGVEENEPANLHCEIIDELCNTLDSPSLRKSLLYQDDEENDENIEDPFYLCTKLDNNLVHRYLRNVKEKFDCPICLSDSKNGVKLSCSLLKNKPCTSTYCKPCITKWLTSSLSRCPTCRRFCHKIN